MPDLDPDNRLLIAPLAERGVTAVPVVWNDPRVDWAGFDIVVIRSCWDYLWCREEFVEWAHGVPRLANPAEVIAWNTDKRYLRDLAAAGVPVVPTTWVRPGRPWTPPRRGEWVIKPAVSLAGLDTGRYRMADPRQRELAGGHVRRLQEAGRSVMVQPYLDAVDGAGETSLIYLGGAFSHAVRKAGLLTGPDSGPDRRFLADGGRPVGRTAVTAAQREVAARALAHVPGGPGRLLYARVDLIPGRDGSPLLIELELTEPQLFFAHAPEAAERLATAVRQAAAGHHASPYETART